ncbi:MAG: hypothetical protein M1828_002790 [Chrysothrix sp. TS-e1954]|nr:MAG: hypothetical protein M1828_002790 [Chrysothrix sp. TS-e1954]
MSPSAHPNGVRLVKDLTALSYSAARSEDSARELIYALKPEWEHSPGPLEFIRFKDGITNTLFKAEKRRPHYDQSQVDEDAVLLRAYGNGTEVLIDREREARSHELLTQHYLAPALLARFKNGLLYNFIEGSACTPEELFRPNVWPATASLLGKWHAVLPTKDAVEGVDVQKKQWANVLNLLPDKPSPNIWTDMYKWTLALPHKSSSEKDRQTTLSHEVEMVTKNLGRTTGLAQGQYMLCHCDLLSGNVIVRPDSSESPPKISGVSFIDYEYTSPGPAAFDLANHFSEWAGFECNYQNIPTRSQRRAYIECYAESYRAHSPKSSSQDPKDRTTPVPRSSSSSVLSQDTERLMIDVDNFKGIPGLYWGIWALIQADISQIDFDYDTYAKKRLAEYWTWRAEKDGTQAELSPEQSLREQRWRSD